MASPDLRNSLVSLLFYGRNRSFRKKPCVFIHIDYTGRNASCREKHRSIVLPNPGEHYLKHVLTFSGFLELYSLGGKIDIPHLVSHIM
jgi:hypothetical protein